MRQRSKLPGNGGSHPPSRANQPEHQGKLVNAACWLPTELTLAVKTNQTSIATWHCLLQVLLFFILVIGCYMVIIQQKLLLPVSSPPAATRAAPEPITITDSMLLIVILLAGISAADKYRTGCH